MQGCVVYRSVWYAGVCGIGCDLVCMQFKLWSRGVTCVVYRGVWYRV